jgi:hypothetical protein
VEYVNINNDSLINSKKSSPLRELFSESYYKQTIVITIVRYIQVMFLADVSYSSLMSFMPILLNSIGTKITSDVAIYSIILLQTTMGIFGSFLAAYLDTTAYGQKWSAFIGFVMSGVCVLAFLGSSQYWMVVVSTSFINFFDFVGYSSIMSLIPQSYPVYSRAMSMGWANSWCKFGGSISPVTIGLIFEAENGMIVGVFILSMCFIASGALSALLKNPPKGIAGY